MEEKIIWENNITPEDKVEYQTEGGWLTIKEHQPSGYKYAERKGVDSVAFVLFDRNTNDTKRIGVIKEIKPPINRMTVSAFGGSIDQEYYKDDLRVLVKEEVMEEAGFEVELEDIKFYGKVLVSTQMNQFCYLFSVSVDKNQIKERTTTNPAELLSELVWLELPEVAQLEDWKAIVIVAKRIASSDTKITIRPIEQKA